jgi:hypothetical protein
LTYGWLIAGAESGRILDLLPINPSSRRRGPAEFSPAGHERSPLECRRHPSSIRTLQKGDRLTVERGDVNISYVPRRSAPSFRPLVVKPSTVQALVGPLRLRIVPASGGVMLCS